MAGCLHRERQLRSSASTSSLWERRAQMRWLWKEVLACGFPTRNFPLLHHTHNVYSASSKSELQGAHVAQRQWLVAQHLFCMVGYIGRLLLLFCGEQGKGNLTMAAMTSRRSRSVMQEVL